MKLPWSRRYQIRPVESFSPAHPDLPRPSRPMICLTGGPGGGKSTLLDDLARHPDWAGKFCALPEAVQYARHLQISPHTQLFQRAVVYLQIGLEQGLDRALGQDDLRPIICHRGSLDPIAFWKQRGWEQDGFLSFTSLSLQAHYARYDLVIHLVTAADGVPSEYTRWPHAHRPEEAVEAIQLDRWLEEAWIGHPNYHRIDNSVQSWEDKSRLAIGILNQQNF